VKQRIKITTAQAKEITPLVRAAVQLQIECWYCQSEIERRLGIYFKDMEQLVADLAAADDPEKIRVEDVHEFIEGLKVEL
jgi:hypothetical protein